MTSKDAASVDGEDRIRVEAPREVLEHARRESLRVLSPERYACVAKYFTIDSNYAGALFAGLEPNEPGRFTPADLFAVSSLSVSIPARGARRLLHEQHDEDDPAQKLTTLPTVRLEDAEAPDLEAMADFHNSVKRALRKHGARAANAWVTAAKLCARKRPHLFPVRDRRVSTILGFHRGMTLPQEYAVYRSLMKDDEVRQALRRLEDDLRGRERQGGMELEGVRLRLLDVALWMLGEKCSRG